MTIRLELWEGAIDQVERGKSYLFENIKVKVFDDIKYINTTQYTKISNSDDIELDDFSTPDLEENIIQGNAVFCAMPICQLATIAKFLP